MSFEQAETETIASVIISKMNRQMLVSLRELCLLPGAAALAGITDDEMVTQLAELKYPEIAALAICGAPMFALIVREPRLLRSLVNNPDDQQLRAFVGLQSFVARA